MLAPRPCLGTSTRWERCCPNKCRKPKPLPLLWMAVTLVPSSRTWTAALPRHEGHYPFLVHLWLPLSPSGPNHCFAPFQRVRPYEQFL